MADKLTVEHTSRKVIAGRLLAALSEKDQVAVTLTEMDLRRLISALTSAEGQWVKDFRKGLITLFEQAYGGKRC